MEGGVWQSRGAVARGPGGGEDGLFLPRMKFLFLGLLTQGSSRMLCAEKPDSKGYIPNDTIYGGMEGRSQLSE